MKDKSDNEMSFLDHLEELRWHIVRALAAIIVSAIIVFLCKDFVWNTIILGPSKKTFWTYRIFCQISDSLCFGPNEHLRLFTRDFGEQFMMHMTSSFWIGLIIAFPYILWEVWRFVKPGLYDKEQNAIKGVVVICSGLFFLGVLFGYYVVTPFGMSFLTNYTISDEIDISVSLESYVDYLTMFVLPLGLVFELPVVVYFLAKVGIVNAPMLKTFRKHAIVAIVVIAAVITPPDVASQILVSLPLILLYESSIFIAGRTNPIMKEDESKDDDDTDDDDKTNDQAD